VTAYTWASLQTAVATALVQQPYAGPLPADFQTLFPAATSYAEGEIARDLVLLNTRGIGTGITSSVSNVFGLASLSLSPLLGLVGTVPYAPTLPVQSIEGVDVSYAGQPYAYEKASLEFVQLSWPNASQIVTPPAAQWLGRYWAMVNDSAIILGPNPGSGLPISVTGLFLAAPIGPTNQQTYVSTYYGDLLLCATMVWMNGGLLRNWGAASDEPQASVSWNGQYHQLLPGCIAEEKRRRGLAPDVAAPIAAAERG
jgi:hypothetical protein